MSIQTELARLTNAKAAIQTAIEGKGVTVPDGTLLDGMAALIDAIEAGGGGAKYSYGSFTPSEDGQLNVAYAIEHNSGFVPDVFVVSKTNPGTFLANSMRYAVSYANQLMKGTTLTRYDYTSLAFGWGSAVYNTKAGTGLIAQETTSTLAYINVNVDLKVIAGTKYKWFATGGLE